MLVLVTGSPEGKEGAARAIKALSCSAADAEARTEAALRGAIPALSGLLASTTSSVKQKEAAAGAIAALGTKDILQVAFCEAGVVPHLINLLQRGTVDAKDAAAGALCALSWHADVAELIGSAGAVPVLCKWLASGKASPAGAAACAGALDNLTLTSGDARNVVAAAPGVLAKLVDMELRISVDDTATPDATPSADDDAAAAAGTHAAAACLRNLSGVNAHAKAIEAMRADKRDSAVQSVTKQLEEAQLVTPRRGVALVLSTVALLLGAPMTSALLVTGTLAVAAPSVKIIATRELGPRVKRLQAALGVGASARKVVNPFPQYGRLAAT